MPRIEHANRINATAMSFETTQLLASLHVPKSERLIVSSTGEDLTMVEQRQLLHPMGMLSLEGTQFFSSYDVPERQGSPPCGGEDAPVVEHDEARDPPFDSLEAAELVCGLHIPKSDSSVRGRRQKATAIEHGDTGNT